MRHPYAATWKTGALFLAGWLAGCSNGLQTGERGEQLPLEVDGQLTAALSRPALYKRTSSRGAPLTGGTLTVSRDRSTLVALDGDSVYLVDVSAGLGAAKKKELQLAAGDWPTRAVEGAAGQFFILERGSGAISKITSTGALLKRQLVCAEPRGLLAASDKAEWDTVYVACLSGDLFKLSAADLSVTWGKNLALDDLRDLVMHKGKLQISRFRSAQLLQVDPESGKVESVTALPELPSVESSVGWRLLLTPGPGGVPMLIHQQARRDLLPASQWGGTTCPFPNPDGTCENRIAAGVISWFTGSGAPPQAILPKSPLPMDAAIDEEGASLGLVAVGNSSLLLKDAPPSVHIGPLPKPGTSPVWESITLPAGFKAVAIAAYKKEFVVQTRDETSLYRVSRAGSGPWTATPIVTLDAERGQDLARDLFHSVTSSGGACASCHPEAGDDGRTWKLSGAPGQLRRTPSLSGLRPSGPYHRDGKHRSMDQLLRSDFSILQRRDESPPPAAAVSALSTWLLGSNPPPWSPATWERDRGLLSRGAEVFKAAQCDSCHGGERFSNGTKQKTEPGALEAIVVPSLLGVARRAPYLTSGCAGSLGEVFDNSCPKNTRGGVHDLSKASPIDLTALLAYLASL